MLRGWILAAAGVGTLSAATAFGQGVSLAERLGFASDSPSAAVQARRDPLVRQAAVASTSGPRAPRETGVNTKRRSGGSFFSRIHLPNLLGAGAPQAREGLDDAPMPYDPAELEAQGATSPPVQATTPPARRSVAPVAVAPRQKPSTSSSTTTTAAPPAGPRIARSSPRINNRHNELADALTGLRINHAPMEQETAPADVADAARDVAPPAAASGESTPSYLNDAGVGLEPGRRAAPRPQATRGASRGPIDMRDALLGNNPAPTTAVTPAPSPAATTTTTPPPTRRAAVMPPAPRITTPTPPPAQPSPVETQIAESDVASALEDDASEEPAADVVEEPAPDVEPQDEPLGAIAAEPTPPDYESPPAVTPEASRTPVTESKPTPQAENVARGIGNLRSRKDVLLSCEPPVIVSSVAGPNRIAVGREAEYRVVLQNKGEVVARELLATIAVPSWAEIAQAAATNGAVDRSAPAEGESQTIKWQLFELPPRSSQTLTLQLIPRSGQPLLLAVQCDQAPIKGEATVDVQEPKLQMEITGPGEVMYGKSQRYSLILSNPGTGDAEDVNIELTPPGGDPNAPVRHKVGPLAAGSSRTIELELTAREAGDLKMTAAAIAAGGIRSEAVKTVMCRRAQLDIDWRGPEKNFAGAVATYYFRVRNQGTAPASEVAVDLSLPGGAELVDASNGYTFDDKRHKVSWRPGVIGAGEERFMQLQCKLATPGVNQMELVARTEAGDLSDVQMVPVTVEALADLKLQVSDPEGVLPVGDTAVYEIRVQNRGMIAARGVNVVAMFSEGIDPTSVEGGQHEVKDGRVAFRTIDALPAGAEVVLRIHAKASQPGTHVFRTEVVCDDVDAKLVAEETTRYFVEEERWADASAAYSEQPEGATTR
jgi:hypothetical protein